MTTPGPVQREPRRCQSCGYRFVPSGADAWYCSAVCAGRAAMTGLLGALQQFAANGGTPR